VTRRARVAAAAALALACLPGAVVLAGDRARGAPPPPAWMAERPYPPVPIGPPPRFQPAAAAGPRETCRDRRAIRHLAHLELFAEGKVVIIPGGLGIGGPLTRRQGRVVRGGCRQPVFTTEPTGVLAVAERGVTLGDLFDVWRQPLTRDRMLSFRGRVRAYVAGRPWRGDPRAIPLARHAQIVVQVGPYIRPHVVYPFPPGLEAPAPA
jgi:hypothetical protein